LVVVACFFSRRHLNSHNSYCPTALAWPGLVSLGSTRLFSQPVSAQFGIAGKRKRAGGGDFQEQQQMAEQHNAAANGGAGDAAGMAQLQELMMQALNDPAALKQFESLGAGMAKGLEEFSKLSPDEVEAQMKLFYSTLTDGSLVDTVVNKRDEVLKTLEATNAVPPEELEKFKTNPAYFELKMRESFQDMQQFFSDPSYLETVQKMHAAMKDPSAVTDVLKQELGDDEKLEVLRLQFLKGDHPLAAMFEGEEMQEILRDPVKFKETLKEGMEALNLLGDSSGGLDPLKEEL